MKQPFLYLVILFLTTLSLTEANAQSLQFKFGGGLSSRYGKASPVGAYRVGVGYEIEFDQHFTFTPGLAVYGKGWKYPNSEVFVLDEDGNQRLDEETGEPLKGIKSVSTTQNYIQLPLLFSYYLRTGESRYVVISAGPYAAVGVSGHKTTKGDTERLGAEQYFYETKTFSESGVKRFEAGFQVMAGYQFPLGLTIGLEADFGLTRFNAQGDRNVSGLLTVGYKLSR